VEPTTCGQANGMMEFEVNNAIGTPSFFINGAAAVTNLNYPNLSAGKYDVLVVDEEGCQDSIKVNIEASEGIAFTDTLVTQPTCGLDNGSISLSTNNIGGSTMLTLNGQPAELNNTNLPSGTYDFMIADDVGCVDSMILTLPISEPVAIVSLDTVGTSCALPNGSLSITESTGFPTEFSYNGIDYFPESDFLNLPAGNYMLYAQNENCADTIAFTIDSSMQPELTLAAFEGTDCGDANGSVDLNVINGSGPYVYNLDSLNNNTGQFETLPAGEYVAYVQDFLNCQDSTDVNIADSEPVVLTAVVTEGNCGTLGAIELVGLFGDTNEFANGDGNFQSSSIYNELEGGEYVFYVRTAEDCLDTLMINVPVYSVPVVEIVSREPAYCEESVAKLIVSGRDGKGTLSFALDGQLSESATFENLAAGIYTMLVTDETGCTSTGEVEIEATPAVRIENLSAEQLFCGDLLSAVMFTPEGGTGALSYTLTDLTGNEMNEADGLPEGQYRLKVVDEVGCELSEIIVVKKEDCQIYIPTIFDPSSDNENTVFKLGVPNASDFFITSFMVFDRWGNLIYNKKDVDPLTFTDWWDGTFNGAEVAQGVYVYKIKLGGIDKSEQLTGTITLLR